MIISHRHKFIFLKTTKTAGTSVELALSKLCAEIDIITPQYLDDEETQAFSGRRGGQNIDIPVYRYRPKDFARLLVKGRRRFHEHATAKFVQRYIDAEVWNAYFKFAIERNPFDKAISRYFWSVRSMKNPPDLETYVLSAPRLHLSNWPIYTINDEIAVDLIVRYESLADDLKDALVRIGINSELSLPRAKSSYRRDQRHYSQLLSHKARQHLERVCANEIAAFDYSWTSTEAS